MSVKNASIKEEILTKFVAKNQSTYDQLLEEFAQKWANIIITETDLLLSKEKIKELEDYKKFKKILAELIFGRTLNVIEELDRGCSFTSSIRSAV